jgi:lipopolysaccharide transport system permease protein
VVNLAIKHACHYLNSIWEYRFFWFSLVKSDLRMRYARSSLGIGWSLLNPIAMTIVLCVIFGTMFDVNIGEYAPFALTGLAFWTLISGVILQGSLCFLQNASYIFQEPAPVAIYPLRIVLSQGFHFCVGLAVALVLSWGINGEGNLLALLSLVPVLLLLFVLGWSLAVLAAFANAFFPDAQHLSEVALQIVFYLTPIIYPPRLLYARRMGWLVDYNPLAGILSLLRAPILEGKPPLWEQAWIPALAVVLLAGGASFFLAHLKNRLIFQL